MFRKRELCRIRRMYSADLLQVSATPLELHSQLMIVMFFMYLMFHVHNWRSSHPI